MWRRQTRLVYHISRAKTDMLQKNNTHMSCCWARYACSSSGGEARQRGRQYCELQPSNPSTWFRLEPAGLLAAAASGALCLRPRMRLPLPTCWTGTPPYGRKARREYHPERAPALRLQEIHPQRQRRHLQKSSCDGGGEPGMKRSGESGPRKRAKAGANVTSVRRQPVAVCRERRRNVPVALVAPTEWSC